MEGDLSGKMKPLILALILTLGGVNPYPIAQGNKVKSGWERVAKFSLAAAGYLYLFAEGEAIIVSSAGDVAPFFRDLKQKPKQKAAPGIYYLFLKSPTRWKLLFLPIAQEIGHGNEPMSNEECDRWLRKKNLLEEGKAVSSELETMGIFTTFQAEDLLPERIDVEFPWFSWWDEKKLSVVPDFKPVYDPGKAHYIYKLPFIMHSELMKKSGIYCLRFSSGATTPLLPEVYRFLNWHRIDLRLFNSIGIRLNYYLKMRQRGLSPEEAFLRADTRARLEYSDTQKIFSDLPDIFESIYRRYFQ